VQRRKLHPFCIHQLNNRKGNLDERIGKSGNSGFLLIQLRKGLAEKHVDELNTFITGVEARKVALN
jgi:hypothetical protein